MKQTPGPELDSERKQTIRIFTKYTLSIWMTMNLYAVDFLELQ